MLDHIKYMVLWVTNDCNLRCKYCYANGGDKKEYMSLETAKKAINLIKGNCKLQLAGGEPLLNFELIKEMYDYLKKYKPYVKMQIQTNGTIIDDKIAKWIRDTQIPIGISLDGTFEVNELLRGNTKEAIEGIKILGSFGIMTNLNCVATSQNIEKLDELVDLAFYLGNIGGIGLDLLRETGRAKGIEVRKALPEQIKKSLWKAWKRTEQLYNLSGKRVVIREIEDAKKRISGTKSCSVYCNAVSGSSVVILPYGDMYPCGSLISRKAYYMGNVYDEISYKNVKLDIKRPQNCNNCKYTEICIGACPARSIINAGNLRFTQEDCALRKTAFQIAEKEYKNVAADKSG